ncbi:hypothetical protein Efla_002717 [Eimeria flavescens]
MADAAELKGRPRPEMQAHREEPEAADAGASGTLTQQLQQLQQRLTALRWGQEASWKQHQQAGGVCGSESSNDSQPDSDGALENEESSEAEPDMGSTHTSSLGSIVMSLAASAAQSVAERINQSAQQLFKPPGFYKVTERVFLCEVSPSDSPLAPLLPVYVDNTYANRYLVINMSDRKYNPAGLAAAAATPSLVARSGSTPRSPSTATSSERESPRQQQQQEQQQQEEAPAAAVSPQTAAPAITSFRTGAVIDAGFRGLPYPPLRLCLSLCMSAGRWLRGDPNHVLLLQCFRGLGRSASFAAAFLTWFGAAANTAEAQELIAVALGIERHTLPLLPSQKRFLAFFESMMELPLSPSPLLLQHQQQQQMLVPRRLRRVIFCGLPAIEEHLSLFLKDPAAESPKRGSSGDEAAAAADAAAAEEHQQQPALLFRPVLEVWLQGSLLYSSVLQHSPAGCCVHTPEGEQPSVEQRLQDMESPLLCCCQSRALPTYSPEEGSLRFELSGMEACGDLLLRLLHVVPEQQQQQEGYHQQQEQEWQQERQSSCSSAVCGRKISMVRAAFHTGLIDAAGYVSFTKQDLDGGPMLAAAFPDDCFLAAFFDPLGAPPGAPLEAPTGAPHAVVGLFEAGSSKPAQQQEACLLSEDIQQLVERVREEGRQCRLQQQQELQQQQQQDEAATSPFVQAELLERARHYRELAATHHLSPSTQALGQQQHQQVLVRQLTDAEPPECLDTEDWDCGEATTAAATATAMAASAKDPGRAALPLLKVLSAKRPQLQQEREQQEESESDISWGRSDDELELEDKTCVRPSLPEAPSSSNSSSSNSSNSLLERNQQVLPSVSSALPAQQSAEGHSPQSKQQQESPVSVGSSSSGSSSDRRSSASLHAASAAAAAAPSAAATLRFDSSSDGEDEGGLPVLGSRSRNSSGAARSAATCKPEAANGAAAAAPPSAAAAAAPVAPAGSEVISGASSNSDWVALASTGSSPVLLASPRLLPQDTTSSSSSNRSSGKNSRATSPKARSSLFVILGHQQAQQQQKLQQQQQTQRRREADTGKDGIPLLKPWSTAAGDQQDGDAEDLEL